MKQKRKHCQESVRTLNINRWRKEDKGESACQTTLIIESGNKKITTFKNEQIKSKRNGENIFGQKAVQEAVKISKNVPSEKGLKRLKQENTGAFGPVLRAQ